MTKNNKQIAKALLTSFSTFGKYLVALDKDILNRAQYSYMNYEHVFLQVSSICDMIGDGEKLRAIKERIERVLGFAPEKYEKVLYLHYYHQLSITKIAKTLDISERTVSRRIKEAVDWFAERLDEVIDLVSFKGILQRHRWLSHLFNSVNCKRVHSLAQGTLHEFA